MCILRYLSLHCKLTFCRQKDVLITLIHIVPLRYIYFIAKANIYKDLRIDPEFKYLNRSIPQHNLINCHEPFDNICQIVCEIKHLYCIYALVMHLVLFLRY